MDELDGLEAFLGMSVKRAATVEPEPWMKTVTLRVIWEEELPQVVTQCIEAGVYGLDIEATGLDSRVFQDVTQDKIVGICLAPDTSHGYYVPLRHQKGRNVSWGFFERELVRLIQSKSIAVFHNAKYDQEMIEYDPGLRQSGIHFNDVTKWEDTMLLALLDDSKSKQRGLKYLAGSILQRKMIELAQLFPPGTRNLDFSLLDPASEEIGWYAGADAVNTLALYLYFRPRVCDQTPRQGAVYRIEKGCLLSVRWMERNRLKIDLEKVQHLIQVGQDEAFASLAEVYRGASELLGRDVTPTYFRHLQKNWVQGDPEQTFSQQVEQAIHATRFWGSQEKNLKVRDAAGREYPERYDVMSPQQLGSLLEELKVPGLRYTEKSEQVSTKAKDMDELLESVGESMPFLVKIKRFRNTQKALGTYLVHLWEDTDRRDNTLRVKFKQDGTDTGRFSTPGERNENYRTYGGTKFNLHSLPQAGKKGVPDCLARIREVLIAEEDEFIVSIDFSGVELRIITNLSREPLWIQEFFRCDGCGKKFDQGDGTLTPPAPPKFCPDCGSDKIGDLHTLTGIAIYGAEAKGQKDWKTKRGKAKCVHPDTLIFTQDGLVRMGSLPRGEVDTFTPVEGQEVWGSEGCFRPLLESYNGGTKALYHVVTRHGIITCSDQHGFALPDGTVRTLADGLSEGTDLASVPLVPSFPQGSWETLTYRPLADLPPMQFTPSVETAYFAGLFLGDGSKLGRTSVGISHGSVDKIDRLGFPYRQWQQTLIEACEAAGLRPQPKNLLVTLGSRHVMRFLEALGLIQGGVTGSRNLRVPDWVLAAGYEGAMHFLGGLIDTDGTVTPDGTLSLTSKDPVFIGQVAALTQALGIETRTEANWNKTYQKYYFRMFVRASQSRAFIPYLRQEGKRNRLVGAKDSGRLPNRVLNILPAGEGPCMDIHTGSEDHLYWANGVLTHNSTNFALSYGGGPSAVVRAAGVEEEEAYRIKDKFDNTYAVLKGWWKAQHGFVRKHGYVVTPFGRKCPLPDIRDPDRKVQSKAERNATNAPVQGFSADITKLAMGAIYQECLKRGWLSKAKMLITIHDELVFAIKRDILQEAIEVFYEIMTNHRAIQMLKYPVPLTSDVEIGVNWAVPWNLPEIRATGKWPEELIPYFSDASKASEAPQVPAETAPAQAASVQAAAFTLELLHMPTAEVAEELRNVFRSCPGESPVSIALPGGALVETDYKIDIDRIYNMALPGGWIRHRS